jgi:hypothetical protein
VRRLVPLLASVVLLLTSCSGFREVGERLSPSPSASITPSPIVATGPSATGGTGEEPAIVVRTPRVGDELVSPVTVSGAADVFEATVGIVIVSADGEQLAATFATATCGSGCWGRYSADLAFFVQERTKATIQVFEQSAEDGSVAHLVEIPVTLVPGT